MIRKANLKDISAIYRLLQIYGDRGELLPRPLSQLYDHVRDFSVHVDPEQNLVVGCCALHICWEDLAEIRSLAVHPDHRNKKIGAALVEAVMSEARSFNLLQVFTLTYQPEFFKKYGFVQIEKARLPHKIWADCLLCVKYPDCDEIAMMKRIGQE